MDVQHLILQRHHVAQVQGDVASHHDIAMMRRRCLIERAGGLGSPIDQHGCVLFVGQPDAPDVQAVVLRVIKTSEHQAILHAAQLYETILVHGGEGIPFGALCGRAVGTGRPDHIKALFRLRTQCVQTIVGAGDRALFFLKLRGIGRHLLVSVPSRCVKTQTFQCTPPLGHFHCRQGGTTAGTSHGAHAPYGVSYIYIRNT